MDDTNTKAKFVYKKGDQIGQYEVIGRLDLTRFGHTYLGQHIHARYTVMIEVFTPPLMNELKEVFLAQARTLRMLAHPHILYVRDAGIQDHYPFLVTDYGLYLTLRQIYPQGGVQPLVALLPHLKQIASALQYAHNSQVLHGDICPENILLDGNNSILLRGFMLEAIPQNLELLKYQKASTIYESIAYSAPEQISGKAGPASDQYSLAVLIYELLCGALPFEGSSIEIAHSQMHSLPPSMRQRVPEIPERVERAVMKALRKDPARRFPNVQAFIDTLEREQFRPVVGAVPGARPSAAQAPVKAAGMVLPRIAPQRVVPSAQPPNGVSPVQALPGVGRAPGRAPTAFQPQGIREEQHRPVSLASQGVLPAPAPLSDEPVRTTVGALPGAHPAPAPRRGDKKLSRRAFLGVGLVGLAAAGGAGGWYLLTQRLKQQTLPNITSNTPPPAKRMTIDNRNVLVFTGHLASVNSIAWSPDGKLIASASDDTYVEIFDASSGQLKVIYSGHTEEVAAVAWSPDGKLIASGGQDGTVQVWNAASKARIFTYKGHSDRVNGVSWSNDSQMIASGSDDKTVQVWTALNGALSFDFEGHTAGVLCVGWQPDNSSVASGSWDGTLRDWAIVQHGDHFNAGDQIFSYGGHGNNEVSALAWSPDGNFIASAGADQTVQISNGVDGTPRPPFFTGHESKLHVNPVLAVSWSPDGSSIASGDSDGNVYVWKTAGRKTFFIYGGHKGAINAVAWSPDGKTIASASADNTVHVWQPGA